MDTAAMDIWLALYAGAAVFLFAASAARGLGKRPKRAMTALVRSLAEHFDGELRPLPRLVRGGPTLQVAELMLNDVPVTAVLEEFDIGSMQHYKTGRTFFTEWRLVVRAQYRQPGGPVFGTAGQLRELAQVEGAHSLPSSAQVSSDGDWITVAMKAAGLGRLEAVAAVEQVAAMAGGEHS